MKYIYIYIFGKLTMYGKEVLLYIHGESQDESIRGR